MALTELGIKDTENLSIYKSIMIGVTKYTSIKSRVNTTIDYVIETNSGLIGAIQYFFIFKHIYALIEVYNIISSSDHLKKIEKSGFCQTILAHDIKKKLIYMKMGRIETVAHIPNHYEKS